MTPCNGSPGCRTCLASDITYLEGEERLLQEPLKQTLVYQPESSHACQNLTRMIKRTQRLVSYAKAVKLT